MSFVPLKKRGKALEWKLAASLEFPKGKNSVWFLSSCISSSQFGGSHAAAFLCDKESSKEWLGTPMSWLLREEFKDLQSIKGN